MIHTIPLTMHNNKDKRTGTKAIKHTHTYNKTNECENWVTANSLTALQFFVFVDRPLFLMT